MKRDYRFVSEYNIEEYRIGPYDSTGFSILDLLLCASLLGTDMMVRVEFCNTLHLS
jgi:hypothetical protein